MNVELWPISRPIPYSRNPRRNDGPALGKVKASLKEFGWQQPIVVDKEGVIIVGHTRHKAAYELGLKECPVVVAANLSPNQVKAYRLADNRTGQEATWDAELLVLELDDLKLADFDLALTGFNPGEMDAFRAEQVFDPASQDDQGKLDEKKKVCCPECGHEFAP